ncbi:hypothetical protein RCO48_13485 [Peribacillus frigoritolerans]|nr:hypothetical protein [Peribacillus frigoritolerans]
MGFTTPQDITILAINKDGGFDTEVKRWSNSGKNRIRLPLMRTIR